MARAIWKGAITFGLVTIPVGLYSAVERRGELAFRLLHARESSRIDYRHYCEEENVEVPWSEIVRGYEYERGQYVVMTEEDFDKARVPATQTIAISDFVPASAIDAIYFDHPYYVAPTGKAGTKAYALLRDALAETGRIGIGTLVLRQREHLVSVHPSGEVLAVTTLRWAPEVRSPKDLDVPGRGEGWSAREMTLARQLVDTLAGDWEPAKYRDSYREALLDIIQKKIEGEEVVAPTIEKPRPVVNLVRALEQSLKTPRKPAARAERPKRRRRSAA